MSKIAMVTGAGTGVGRRVSEVLSKDGIVFPIKIDCAKSKISVIDDAGELSVVDLVESHNTGTKDMLKSKWKEIMKK